MATYHAKVLDGGRIVLPAEVRRAMDVKPGDSVSMVFDGTELHVTTSIAALRKIQDLLRPFRGDGLIVDEFLADRRRDAV